MPSPPLRPCTAPGCPNRVAAGRCPTHSRYNRMQRATWTEVYGPQWPRIRLEYLQRHPRCQMCPRMARIPDHYPVGIRQLRARGITNPHADRYLRPLCWSCHSKTTGAGRPSGWAAQQAR